jgi:predicted nucleic acid-binding protein
VIEGLGISFTPTGQLLDLARAVESALHLPVDDVRDVALADRLNLPLATADTAILVALRKSTWPITRSPIGIWNIVDKKWIDLRFFHG